MVDDKIIDDFLATQTVYEVDPKLTKMNAELIKELQDEMVDGNFDRHELPKVLGFLLGVSYCHEFFRMAEIMSNQLDILIDRLG